MRFDVPAAWQTVRQLFSGFAAALPRLVLALLIVGLFYLVAKAVRALVRRNAKRRATVEDIETRATFIKTSDGRRVIILNGELYTLQPRRRCDTTRLRLTSPR
jgi:hypothetical protein